MSFLSNVLTGVSLGSIYAIIALGYTMVYGIAKMLNFAHGDIIMVGAFTCFFATGRYGLPPLVSVLLAMVVCTTLGIVIEGLAYRPLREAPAERGPAALGGGYQDLHPCRLRLPFPGR